MHLKTRQLIVFLGAALFLATGCDSFKPIQGIEAELGSTTPQAPTGTPPTCVSPFADPVATLASQKISSTSEAFTTTTFQYGKMDTREWGTTLAAGQNVTMLVRPDCTESTNLDSVIQLRHQKSGQSISGTLKRGISRAEIENLVQQNDCVIGVSPEIQMKKFALPNDPFIAQQRHIASIGLTDVYDLYSSPLTGLQNDVVIAVIDDGIDLTHVDLRDRIWVNARERAGTAGVDDDDNGYIDDINGYNFAEDAADPSHLNDSFHGTHVAGLIAATGNNAIGVTGVIGHHSRLMILNVFGDTDTTSASYVDNAIRYAADNGAKVINMSLGGPGRSATTRAAIEYAISRGVVILAAAGNDGRELTSNFFMTPASYAPELPGLISVAATDTANTMQLCSFSNFGATYVELAAPGCDSTRTDLGLFSTLPGNLGGYLAGTSMATPIATGSVALVIGELTDRTDVVLTPAQIENLILSSSATQSGLTTSVLQGRQLSLRGTADAITNQYLKTRWVCD
jgi:subtilisin family serine protease